MPAVVLYEVYKFVLRELGDEAASRGVARLRHHPVIEVDDMLALAAAEVSLRHGLAMADAMIYATADAYDAPVVTSDADLKNLPGVVYLPKPPTGGEPPDE